MTEATVSRNKEKVYDEASKQFFEMFNQALRDNSVKNNINDAFNMQKNENILNVIYSRFEHHIETVMKMNDVTAKGDIEAKTIDGIVFNHFITTLENPNSPLSQFIKKILNKHSYSSDTPFFIVKENLIQYLTGNKKSGGGNGQQNVIQEASSVKALKDDVTQQLKQIVSRMKGEIKNRIPDKINEIFDDATFKKNLDVYIKDITEVIKNSIVGSPFFKTDLFSIVYFYKLMKKIEKDNDDTKKNKINEVLNILKTGGVGTPGAAIPVVSGAYGSTTLGGRRTRRLSRGKKRTQRKRHNKKKNTTCRKK